MTAYPNIIHGGNEMIPQPIKRAQYDRLNVEVYETSVDLGKAAALRTESLLTENENETGRLLFSTGASQFDFMAALKERQIDWSKIEGFHLDEYLGMEKTHSASFRLWLETRIEQPFKPKVFHYIEGDAADPEAEMKRYDALLRQSPIDIGFIGIGENGHVAFNDPPVADFNDPHWVKIVELDEACKKQQMGEGWFPTINDVPTHAITLTIPAIMGCSTILSIVPDARKAEAVKNALTGPINESCPASILRRHENATLFLDKDSAAGIL